MNNQTPLPYIPVSLDAPVLKEEKVVAIKIEEKPAVLQAADMVKQPPHYKQGGMEVIKILRAKLSPEEFEGFCKGNILKYVMRSKHKNGVEDLKKAQVYLKWLIEAEEKKNANS